MALEIRSIKPLFGINPLRFNKVATKPVAIAKFADTASFVSELDKFANQNFIYEMVKSNPTILKILKENKIPLHIHMNTLADLKGHLAETRNLVLGIFSNLPNHLKAKVNVEATKKAAVLHDFGKCLIPKKIFNAPHELNKAEKEVMDLHPVFSYEILKNTGLDSETLRLIKYHHQNLNKDGYPKVDDDFICDINNQLVSIADEYSALREKRSYKPAKTPEVALAIIEDEMNQGKFHPEVFNALSAHVKALESVKASAKLDEIASLEAKTETKLPVTNPQRKIDYANLIKRFCAKFLKPQQSVTPDLVG